jgi:hypothetical protein
VKALRSIFRRRLVLGLFAGLVLLAILLHSLVQAHLAAPTAQVLWWLRLRFLAIPQDTIWMIFLVLAYLLFYASLFRPRHIQPWQWEEAALSPEQPFSKLVKLVENSSSSHARRRLCQKVSELAVAAIAERTGRSPHQVKSQILGHQIKLPEDVANYIHDGLQSGEPSGSGDRWGIASQSLADTRLIRILEFLENEEWMEHIYESR